jgi:hypothetical protein
LILKYNLDELSYLPPIIFLFGFAGARQQFHTANDSI